MSFTALTSEVRKARKDHCCVWCREKILAGENCFYQSGPFDGVFQSNYWHIECDKAAGRDDDLDDGFTAGECRRGMTYRESDDVRFAEPRSWN